MGAHPALAESKALFVSYAQNGEDVLLNRVFSGVTDGFYLDVGAYDPVNGSVTKAFYDRGWSGINVEPGEIFLKLEQARPRDINLQLAVLGHSGQVSFLADGSDAATSRVVACGLVDGSADGLRLVECRTLGEILAHYAPGRQPDFLKIDAEGSEKAIVTSTDWWAIRPTVLVIEATLPWTNELANSEWEAHLVGQRYRRVHFDGINCYYLPEERCDIARHFSAPVNAVDYFVRYDASAEVLRMERDRSLDEIAGLKTALARTAADCDGLKGLRDQLSGRLAATLTELDRLLVESDRVRQDRDRSCANLEELRRDHVELQAAFDREVGCSGRLAAFAAERHRLSRELRWPGGPLAIRVVLPISQLLRWLRRVRMPSVLPEEVEALEVLTRVPVGGCGHKSHMQIAGRESISTLGLDRPVLRRLVSERRVELHDQIARLEEQLAEAIRVSSAGHSLLEVQGASIEALRGQLQAEMVSVRAELQRIYRLMETSVTALALERD